MIFNSYCPIIKQKINIFGGKNIEKFALIGHTIIFFLAPFIVFRCILKTQIGQKLLNEFIIKYGLLGIIVLVIIIAAIFAVICTISDMTLWPVFVGIFVAFFMGVIDNICQCSKDCCIK